MIGRLTLVAALLAAPMAAAQDSPAKVEATPEQIAAARAEGDRIIAVGQAGGVFENLTEDAMPRLRHIKSGMVCVFEAGNPLNNVRIYPLSPITPAKGDDVSCGTNMAGAALTIYATRYTPMISVEEDLAATVNGVVRAWPDATPLAGDFPIAARDGQEPPAFAALKFRRNGETLASFAMIRHVDGWSFKLRASGLETEAHTIVLVGGVMFSQAVPGK